MRQYLATLHKRPEHHKKQFAFLVSGSVAVIIFVVWALVTFGNSGVQASRSKNAASPLESLKSGVQSELNTYGR